MYLFVDLNDQIFDYMLIHVLLPMVSHGFERNMIGKLVTINFGEKIYG